MNNELKASEIKEKDLLIQVLRNKIDNNNIDNKYKPIEDKKEGPLFPNYPVKKENLAILTKHGYSVINKRCSHFPFSNRVTIFPCCKKAYNCWQCHDIGESHKFDLLPDVAGYCLKCYKFREKIVNGDNCAECLIKF